MIGARAALRGGGWALLVAAGIGCQETQECIELKKLVAERKIVLEDAAKRASVHAAGKRRAEQLEKEAKAILERLGVDQSPAALTELLRGRTAGWSGVTLTMEKVPDPDLPPEKEGAELPGWKIRYRAPTLAAGLEKARALSASPPLFRLRTIVHEGGPRYRVELVRGFVEQVPLDKLTATPLRSRTQTASVAPAFGFCGAGELRAEIARLDGQIDELKPKALETSVLLPTAATWMGVRERSRQLEATESEVRALMSAAAEAVQSAGLRLKAIGAAQKVVIAEFYGGAAARRRFERALPPELLAQAKVLPSTRNNVARVSLPTRGAFGRGHRGGPHDGHGHGHGAKGPGTRH